MENRKLRSAVNARSFSTQKLKFKEIPLPGSSYNELNSKYELYKNGTPNVYSSDLDLLKIKNLKNEISSIDLPAIDYIVNNLCRENEGAQVNNRNYEMYPNLMVNNFKGKYKEMLSEKKEIKDFVVWFENELEGIERNKDTQSKKFKDKQTLIAAGFT